MSRVMLRRSASVHEEDASQSSRQLGRSHSADDLTQVSMLRLIACSHVVSHATLYMSSLCSCTQAQGCCKSNPAVMLDHSEHVASSASATITALLAVTWVESNTLYDDGHVYHEN